MAFDGVVVKCIVDELSSLLEGGRVEKIFQPEADEIVINIRAKGRTVKLVLSASASYPRIHATEESKDNPSAPPMFCMLLRRHLSGGRLVGIDLHDFERIITLNFEAVNELGDLAVRKLIIEIMGRYSNIIFLNGDNRIIDAIKHVDADISSVREVMPARPYILPPAQDKVSPEAVNTDLLFSEIIDLPTGADTSKTISSEKFLLNGIKGFSPLLCREICHRAGVDSKTPVGMLSRIELQNLKQALAKTITDIKNGNYKPCIIYNDETGNSPLDFHCLEITDCKHVDFLPSMSEALDLFYSRRDWSDRLRQRKSDLYKVLTVNTERCARKLAVQEDKLREVADREKLQLFGELITANIYNISKGTKKAVLQNYYSEDGGTVEIPMDENLSPQENAQRYFKQYSKAKSAYINTSRQVEESRQELEYLESVVLQLDNSSTLQDIEEIRQELSEQGYTAERKRSKLRKGVSGRKGGSSKKQEKPAPPHMFVSSDGFEILVGKNNKQNDQLTLKTASSGDMWLHTRNIPGSHVIIRKQQRDIPDSTLLEAAMLAAFYSKAKLSSNVPVDYTSVRNVKKPSGAKPGMVIYENFRTIIASPDENTVNRLKKP